MLTTKEAISRRRSIRKFKPDPVPDEHIRELLEAARLAPSGCNAQPWRFKIVKRPEERLQMARAAHNQMFIADAPVVIVCCADIQGYLDGSVSGIQDLGRAGAVEEGIVKDMVGSVEQMKLQTLEHIAPRIVFNVAIAIEHMVLRALDFDLGICWVRYVDAEMVKRTFGWEDHMFIVALLPVGYPAESPGPKKRLPLESLLL